MDGLSSPIYASKKRFLGTTQQQAATPQHTKFDRYEWPAREEEGIGTTRETLPVLVANHPCGHSRNLRVNHLLHRLHTLGRYVVRFCAKRKSARRRKKRLITPTPVPQKLLSSVAAIVKLWLSIHVP
jgi:hypothetical protein